MKTRDIHAQLQRLRALCAEAEALRRQTEKLCAELERRLKKTGAASRREPQERRRKPRSSADR